MLETCFQKLEQHGYRLTPLRRSLLTLLHAAQAPLSAPAILRRLQHQHGRINKTTVYRSLELFGQLDIAESTVVNDRTQYFELTERGHHHHLVCTHCERIRDIDIDEAPVLQKAEGYGKRLGFIIQSHALEFYGLCRNCQAGKA